VASGEFKSRRLCHILRFAARPHETSNSHSSAVALNEVDLSLFEIYQLIFGGEIFGVVSMESISEVLKIC
jgi:hypothetical protein